MLSGSSGIVFHGTGLTSSHIQAIIYLKITGMPYVLTTTRSIPISVQDRIPNCPEPSHHLGTFYPSSACNHESNFSLESNRYLIIAASTLVVVILALMPHIPSAPTAMSLD
jgi:hypothetical protein